MAEQNATNPASAAIGEVQSVTGRVVAIGSNGVERQLFAGDAVFPDDHIKTIGISTIVVALSDGSRFDLGRDSEALLDEAVYSDDVAAIQAAALADAAEIQKAIAEGADPAEVADPTAAGDSEGSAGESLQEAGGLERTGRIGLVEAGYETRGVASEFDSLVFDPVDFSEDGDTGSTAGGTTPAALVLTVDAPDNSNDNTPTITGSTDAAAGSTVNLVVTDSVGDVQILTATVQPDGGYSVEVPGTLPDGSYNVDASIRDTSGNTANASDRGSVDTSGGTNDAPVAVDDTGAVDEDATLSVSQVDGVIDSNDSDVDGDTLSVTAIRTGSEAGTGTAGSVDGTTTGTYGTLTLNANGSYTYVADQAAADALADGASASDTFTYEVSDGKGGTDTAEIVITVTGTNDAPVAVDDTGAVDEDATLSVSQVDGVIDSNDSDVDGDTLSVTAIRTGSEAGTGTAGSVDGTTTGTYGTLTLNANGSYTYVADQAAADALADGASASDTFTYEVSDGKGGTDTAEIVITVTGTNDAPVAVDDTGAVDEDATLSVSQVDGVIDSNDSDVDGDTLSVTAIRTGSEAGTGTAGSVDGTTTGTYGTLTLNANGSYTYVADQAAADALADGASASDTFTYEVSDGKGGTDTAEIVITVTGTNDAPVLDLDGGTSGTGYQSDYTEGGPAVPIANSDIDIFDIDSSQFASASITLTNAQAGDQLDISGVLGLGVSVDDTSVPGEITVTLTGPADEAVFEAAIRAITFENSSDSPAAGDRNINVTVVDDGGLSATAVTTIAVNPVPTLSVSDVSVNEPEVVLSGSAVVTGTIRSTGSDTYVDHWTFSHNGGALTIDAGETSGALNPHIRLFELNPDGSLGAQVAADRDSGPGNDARITGSFTAGDYVLAIGDQGLSQSEARDQGIFPNNANDGGDYRISFAGDAFFSGSGDTAGYPANPNGNVVDSGLSGATVVDMTFTVTLDQAPTVDTGDVTVNYEIVDGTANAGADYNVGFANPGSLTFAAGETSKTITVTVNADMVIESNETVLLNLTGLSANANYDGGAHVITDGIQGIGTILSADNPPEILNNSLSVHEGQTVVLSPSDLSATDVDSDDLDLVFSMTNVENGEFQLVSTGETVTSFTQQQIIDRAIRFVHDGSESAPSYDVTVSDGLLIDTGSPLISFVADVNDAPSAADDTYNVFENIAVGTHLGTVAASDPDIPAQALSYTIVGGDPGGLFAVDALGNITLAGVLDADVQAVHFLTVEVSDGALTDTATITINVADTDAPIALDSVVGTAEDSQYAFSSADFDFTDQDGDGMASVTITGLESAGSLRLWNGSDYANVVVGDVISKAQLDNGDLVFDPAPDGNGLPYDSFAFSVNDDSGSTGTTSAVMTVNVAPVDDGPISPVTDSDSNINLVAEDALVGSTVGLSGYADDPDPDDSVSYQLLSNPNGYFSIDPVTGEVTVASPLSVGAFDVVVRATSSDGSSSEETFTIQVVNAADDSATVHESALQGGTGRVESAFDSNDEAGQDVASGQGTIIATGNLLANDSGATAITEINGVTPVGGVITVISASGQLIVDAASGDYTYTLTGPMDNGLTGDGQSALESFSYTTDIGSADLNITIVDDVVESNDVVTEMAEAQVQPYQLVFTLDVSGSMTGAQWGGVVYLDDGSTTTRLEMAKDALAALASEYFSQSNSVELYLSTFSSGASLLNGGAPYTDLQSALTAIDGINGSGGTNYEAGLGTMIDALDANGDGLLDDASSKTITYFISDGVPTSGNTTNPVGAAGWDTFLATNPVDSYGVGIGAGINDYSYLDAINNVDVDGSGTIDGALKVSDVDTLESVLLETVPASYGGSVVVNEGVSHVSFGADGGYIRSIGVELDTDADSSPDSLVTFSYDPTTGLIINDGGLPTVTGEILTLDGPGYGFTQGTLIFNFDDGSYSYFVGAGIGEGDSFSLDFVAADGDGDVADSSRLTMTVVDGAPVANNDVHTLFSNGTSLEGNVITAVGTDGGVALGSAVTSFALQGSGVDQAIDDAQVSAVDYRGNAIDLTVNSTGSGSGNDGSSFNYTVSGGVLTLTNTTDGSQLVFNTTGYYSYVPAELPVSPTAAAVTEVFTDGASGQGVILSTGDGTVTYQATYGAGIDDGVEDVTDARDVDYGETLTIAFDPTSYVYGVANVSVEFYGLTGTYESFDITVYGVNGELVGQYSVGDVATTHTENLPAEYSNIGRIEIQGGSATEASVRQVSFAPVLLDTASAALKPEVIGYTLTDTDDQSDSATLTLSTIHNTLVGGAGNDVVAGTTANDLISGLDGDDTLSGGGGRDILEGGAGDDNLYGEGGSDRLVGDVGDDLLVGADGGDVLLGGSGNDTLQGDAGSDELDGGEGNDTLLGGADDDVLRGNDGADSLDGGSGNDALYGGSGNDILVGGDGDDLLFGNVGNDVMSGGAGGDTFVWKLNEQGSTTEPSVDVLTDFSDGEGDVLDLRDLLLDEQNNELTDYLHFEYDADNDQTVVQIDEEGGLFFRPTQEIVLQGVDLTGGGSLTDQQIIDSLITGNNLITD